jgi:hypothetical protein
VTGYGISNPGRLYQQALALRNGRLSTADRENLLSPMALGFYTRWFWKPARKAWRKAGEPRRV